MDPVRLLPAVVDTDADLMPLHPVDVAEPDELPLGIVKGLDGLLDLELSCGECIQLLKKNFPYAKAKGVFAQGFFIYFAFFGISKAGL